MHLMSETYQSKRERWQRLREVLPEGLRGHISLRNIEAVSSLTLEAQERLAEAMQAGLKHLPRAVEQLKADPNTPLAQLLNPHTQSPSKASREVLDELTCLIQSCFPDMPRLSAEALAGSEVMGIVRRVAEAHQELLASSHIKTDFVMRAAYGLIGQTLEKLEAMIGENPALRQVFENKRMEK
jgi:hypothetical protein